MKKQAFVFISSASLFLINSLSGMEIKDEDPGLGAFRRLPSEKIIPILENLSLHDLNSVGITSKAMETLCEVPEIWRAIAKELPIKINKELNVKNQVKDFYFLFSDPHKTYSISINMLKYLTQTLVPYPAIYFYYRFSIGKKIYRLRKWDHYSIFDTKQKIILHKGFDQDDQITFSLKPNTEYFVSHFSLLANFDCTVGVLLNGVDDETLRESIEKKDEEIKEKFPNFGKNLRLIPYSLFIERDPTELFRLTHPFW
jgi:hypothetical protein